MKRKSKKLIAVIVILMLSITTLAGCSVTDLAYLTLLKESSSIERFSIEGEYTVEFPDPNTTHDRTWSPILGRMVMEPGDMMTINMRLSGEAIQSTDGELYFDITIRYGINDRRMPYSLSVLMVDDKFYIPTEDFVNVIILSRGFLSGYSERITSSMRASAEREFADNDYIVIHLAEIFNNLPFILGSGILMSDALAITNPQANEELTNAFVEAFTRMFDGLDSGMTSVSGNGVTLEITPENAFELFGNVLAHIQTNRRVIYRETINLLEAIENTFRDGDMMQGMYRMIRYELVDNEQEFNAAIDFMAEFFEGISDFERDMLLLTLRGSHLRHTLSRTGDTFNERLAMNITYMGHTYFTLNGRTTSTVTNVTPREIDAQNTVCVMDIDRIWTRIYNQANPVRSISVAWWMDDTPLANEFTARRWTRGDIHRVEGSLWFSIDVIVEDDTVYVPLRSVVEAFGEQVGWDAETRTAYVMRNGERVNMSGQIDQETLFVDMISLEELGFAVEFGEVVREDGTLARGDFFLTITRQ
jgi:hypothetical protein